MTVFTRNFLLRPALLLSLLPSIDDGRRRRRGRRGGGCCKWKPFSFRRLRRHGNGACARCAGGPSLLHRFARPFLSALRRCAYPGHRVLEGPAPRETFLASALLCAGGRIVLPSARPRSFPFLSNAPSPLRPQVCCP